MDLSPIAALNPVRPAPEAPGDAEMRRAAVSFEASFLAEMLAQTGLNAMPAGFGGGAGETAFASLLTEQHARLLAERGGIGLAERVFALLQQRSERA